ncbi:hypothetical protein [Aquamicrobium sp. LC103]|uniref:hypothetical protein n=1 Tax=Aquamicrobium sp. LC103 TaxID=1120658 RepID=UPI001FF065D2|nr:hypothetical protein [Aquamicrobium sp. LC103]
MQDQETSPKRKISVLGRDFSMPRSRRGRIAIGAALVVLGCFGFLPVLGFWMIPLGILVLSYEFAMIRRARRRSVVWWANQRGRRNGENSRASAGKARGGTARDARSEGNLPE